MKKTILLLATRSNRRLSARNLRKNRPYGPVIILTTVTIHTVTAVLDIPEGHLERGERADEILTKAASSTYVSVPPPDILAMRGRLNDYNAATPATRENRWRLVHNDLKELMSTFQNAANDTVADAVAIIESGGFKVKHQSIKQKQEFIAENNAVSGTVDLTAPGGPAHSCHDWKYSADGITWERMRPTVDSHTFKDGLTPKTDAYFTHELVTKDGPQGVSQVIKIIVK
jgi:hypothetical protein